ncbi:hypothetical protein NSU_2352 [Novosphingobium pentaromativorans US6-1]|uniref:Uncharacterized protein n=1 Tax=Novosphingobium pentaromativorans US6-1 TaxID=1088721 RepID=G6EDD2_9SPHN|nr:hypothetical protein NSU_2352 [Novosphingobium pentaromativorans US6-1]
MDHNRKNQPPERNQERDFPRRADLAFWQNKPSTETAEHGWADGRPHLIELQREDDSDRDDP